MEYQIEESWTKDCKAWHYIESESDDQEIIKAQAVKLIKDYHERKLERARNDPFTNTDPSKPRLIIREYPVRKYGVRFTVRWR